MTYLLGDKCPSTFMHWDLAHLLSLNNTNTMLHAWHSINKRYFSLVVVHDTHTMLTTLLLWGMEANKFNIYYLHQGGPVQVGGAAPFSTLNDVMILDAKHFEWCAQIEQRFPKGVLELPGAFTGTILPTMEHIFAPPSVSWTLATTQ